MDERKYEIRQRENKKYYIHNLSDDSSLSEDMESKGELYKVMASLLYPPIKKAYITKKKITLFAL